MIMRDGLRLTILAAAAAATFGTSAHGQTSGTGNATQYTVTLRSFDFCTDAVCSAATVANVGSTDKDIDIASVSAGADAATYANVAVPPMVQGRTYSYVRFKISAVFTIKGSGSDGVNFCNTTSANNNTSTTTAKAGAQAASAAAAAAAATAQQMTVPLVGTFTSPTAAELAAMGITQVGNDLIFIQSVPAFTVGGKAPTVAVKFNTQNTLLFIAAGTPCTLVFPQPPTVTVTFRS